MSVCTLAICMMGALAQAPSTQLTEAVFGRSDVYRLTGNGGLTVGLDDAGAVRVCRWPGPCFPNQVQQDETSSPGMAWGVGTEGKILWLADSALAVERDRCPEILTAVCTRIRTPKLPCDIETETFVHASRDILVSRITMLTASPDLKILYSVRLAPVCSAIPEWAVLDGMGLPNSAFGLFFDANTQTFCHFRPKQAGAAEWERLAHDVLNPSNAEWASYGEGVWCVWTSPNAIETVYRGTTPSSAVPQSQSDKTGAAEGGMAAGACMTPSGEKDRSAIILMAFGKTLAEARSNLEYATGKGFDTLAFETNKTWADILSKATLPQEPAALARCQRDLLTVLQATDRNTGAMAVHPAARPSNAFDSPIESVWAMLALDLMGLTELAGRHADYLATTVRKQDRPGCPRGSVPKSTFAGGLDAVPAEFLDLGAAAWLLGSLWRHSTFLSESDRKEYLSKNWGTVENVAGFLAQWWDERLREPMRRPISPFWGEISTPMRYLETYMGLDSAIRVASALDRAAPPEWRQRKRLLDGLVRLHCLDSLTGQWKRDASFPFWRPEFADAGLPSMKQVLLESLAQTAKDIPARRRILCDLCLVAGKEGDTRQSLLAEWSSLRPPQSNSPVVESALDLIAACLLCTEE